jgi:hypothetical protein
LQHFDLSSFDSAHGPHGNLWMEQLMVEPADLPIYQFTDLPIYQ